MALTLGKFIHRDNALARLYDHAARLTRLQRVVDKLVPSTMRNAVAVANLEDGELTLHVPTSALATRLKMSRDTLLADLQANGQALTSLRIRVRPIQGPGPDISQASAPRQIGSQGRQALEALKSSTRADSPLGEALKKMLDKTG